MKGLQTPYLVVGLAWVERSTDGVLDGIVEGMNRLRGGNGAGFIAEREDALQERDLIAVGPLLGGAPAGGSGEIGELAGSGWSRSRALSRLHCVEFRGFRFLRVWRGFGVGDIRALAGTRRGEALGGHLREQDGGLRQ